MKKSIFAIALALVAFVTMPSIAQTPNSNCPKTECCKEKKCDKKCDKKECKKDDCSKKCDKKKDCKKGDCAKKCDKKKECRKDGKKGMRHEGRHMKAMRDGRMAGCLKGIELTDAQKEAVNKLCMETKEEVKDMKASTEEACKAKFDEMESKLAEILTPEQMAQFLKNKAMKSGVDRTARMPEVRGEKCRKAVDCVKQCEQPMQLPVKR